MKVMSLIFLFLTFSHLPSKAQDTILLMSGKVLTGTVVEEAQDFVVYTYEHKGETRRNAVETYRIFSIKKSGGEERVLYRQNLDEGDDFTTDEMRYYIYGEQDADAGYTATRTFLFGVLAGAGCGWFVDESLLMVAGPFVYTGLHLLPRITIQRNLVRHQSMLQHETYVLGFERVARNRKIQSALKGSMIGLAAGIAGSLLIKPNL